MRGRIRIDPAARLSASGVALAPRVQGKEAEMISFGNSTRWATWWAAIGSAVGDSLQALGDFTAFVGRTLVWLLTSRPQTRTLVPVCFTIGYQSVFVIVLTGFFIGMVLAVQSFHQFQKLGFSTWSGSIIQRSGEKYPS